MDFSEHLWTHRDRRHGIIEGVITYEDTGIIQQFVVIFDIFRPPFEMVKSLPVRWKSRIAVSRAFGDAWLKTNNLPALRVPTVITPGEWNVLVNPLHPQFSLKWIVTGSDAYTFDARLLPVKKGIRSRRTPRDR